MQLKTLLKYVCAVAMLFLSTDSFRYRIVSPAIRANTKMEMAQKSFYVTKTFIDSEGRARNRRVKCTCSSDKELDMVCKSVGGLVDADDTLVTSFSKIRDGMGYATIVDTPQLLIVQGSKKSPRALRLQVSFVLTLLASASLENTELDFRKPRHSRKPSLLTLISPLWKACSTTFG